MSLFKGNTPAPTRIRISGEGNTEVLHVAVSDLIPAGGVTRHWTLRGRVFTKFPDGSYEIFMSSPSFENIAKKLATQLGFKVESTQYGDIKPDGSKPAAITMTFKLVYKGKSYNFDLSSN